MPTQSQFLMAPIEARLTTLTPSQRTPSAAYLTTAVPYQFSNPSFEIAGVRFLATPVPPCDDPAEFEEMIHSRNQIATRYLHTKRRFEAAMKKERVRLVRVAFGLSKKSR
jgi:hypothetical protein